MQCVCVRGGRLSNHTCTLNHHLVTCHQGLLLDWNAWNMLMTCRTAHMRMYECVYECLCVCKLKGVTLPYLPSTILKLRRALQTACNGREQGACVCVCVRTRVCWCRMVNGGGGSFWYQGEIGLWFQTKLSHIKQARSKSIQPLLSVPVWHHDRMPHPLHTHAYTDTHFLPTVLLCLLF